MRERISRGKRIDNNEWIYWNRYGRLTDINGEPTNIEINTSALRPYAFYINELPVIREDAVGDYTGLTDKNGKPIFEGDIIRWQDENFNNYISVVEWCGEKFNYPAFDLAKHDYECNGLQYAHEDCIMEVIGNIHDNPELLEDEQ